MPILLQAENNDGTRNIMIILVGDNIERIQEKDPVSIGCDQPPFSNMIVKAIGISYATEAELMHYEQLCRQGKTHEVVRLATAGWKFRPEKGDHDRGAEPLGWPTENLLYRYHNDARFHSFVERMCEETLAAYKKHHRHG
jgi:hypothetical protein